MPEIADFRSGSKTMAGIAEYSPITFTLVGDDDAVRIDVGLVTGNYFSVMGLSPVIGRSFGDGDDGPSARAGDDAHARVLAEALRRRQRDRRQDTACRRKDGHRGRRAAAGAVLPGTHRRRDEHGEQRASSERDDDHGTHPSHDRDDRSPRARRDRATGARRKWPRSPREHTPTTRKRTMPALDSR